MTSYSPSFSFHNSSKQCRIGTFRPGFSSFHAITTKTPRPSPPNFLAVTYSQCCKYFLCRGFHIYATASEKNRHALKFSQGETMFLGVYPIKLVQLSTPDFAYNIPIIAGLMNSKWVFRSLAYFRRYRKFQNFDSGYYN